MYYSELGDIWIWWHLCSCLHTWPGLDNIKLIKSYRFLWRRLALNWVLCDLMKYTYISAPNKLLGHVRVSFQQKLLWYSEWKFSPASRLKSVLFHQMQDFFLLFDIIRKQLVNNNKVQIISQTYEVYLLANLIFLIKQFRILTWYCIGK